MITQTRDSFKALRLTRVMLAALSLLAVPSAAYAACDLSVEPLRDQVLLRLNTLEAEAAHERIEVRVSNKGDAACIGAITASLRGDQFGLWSDSRRQSIAYRLVDERTLKDITPRSGSDLGTVSNGAIKLGPGESSIEFISFNAMAPETISQGRYTQIVELGIVGRDGISMGANPITLAIEITPSAVIGIKGSVSNARGSAVVELGELSPGRKNLPLTLYVNSTGGYRVTVSSENSGRLKHESSPWFINYELRMGHYPLHLSRPDGFEVSSRVARFDDYPLEIIVGKTEGMRAGRYRDTVTFTVASF